MYAVSARALGHPAPLGHLLLEHSQFLMSYLAIGLNCIFGLKCLAFIFAIPVGNSGIHTAQALRSWAQPG